MGDNPFDDTDGGPAADVRLTKQLEEAAGEGAVSSAREDAQNVEDPFLPGEGPIEVPFESPAKTEKDEQSRADRKGQRFKDMEAARADAERRSKDMESELLRMRALMNTATHPQAPPVPAVSPYKAPIDENYAQRTLLFDAFSGKGANATAADRDEYMKESRRLEEANSKLQYQQNRFEDQQAAPAAQDPVMASVEMMNADVIANPVAKAHALAAWATWTAENQNMKPTAGQMEGFMARARAKAGMAARGGGPGPTDAQRSIHTEGGAGARGAGEAATKIVMSKVHRGMADALYPHIKEPKERYSKWARGAGKGLLKAEKEAGR